ncbi:BRCA1-associated protein isoform X1 [Polypterus senegalus]|uniref:BRCA1-associated protein isoform X1 n=1 Tax=Polypterus senegalus TaxID=55291 RepID=UPI0019655D4A|nr:BRCA1-associated protein isoform X1 [Polypterus senegalus]
MSVSLVVIRLELAESSQFPEDFQYCAEDMSDDEIGEKALSAARACLDGKSGTEKAAILHQHIGSRAMSDMVIETFSPAHGNSSKKKNGKTSALPQDSESGPGGTSGDAESPGAKESQGTVLDSPSKELPDQISFFSGNPSVEIVHGIMHLYKTNKMTSLTEDVRRSAMLCILAVPATMTSHDLMKFVAPFNDVMEHMKIIRDSTPNQYMVLVKFSSQADADSFYATCNGRQFNSIEEAVCQLVYVERAEVIKSEEGASLPVMDLTELPKCTVCLERMDESVNGVLTTLCNHSFHSQCLQRWEDATCPVCRYCQTPEPVEENKCFECGVQENLWICLICGHIGCGRYVSRHAYKHFEETQHTYAMQLTNHRVWDYAGDNYVHRLVASKTDGKIVQYECEGDTCQDEKIDALQLEYSYLLTSQLESQRVYWENKIVHLEKDTAEEINNMKTKFKETIEKCDSLEQKLNELVKEKQSLEKKCTQLNAKVAKLGVELREEQEMNKCLRANQSQLQMRLKEEERRLREMCEQKDTKIMELQEELRDVMFYLQTQQQIDQMPADTRQEIQEGQINIAVATSSASVAPGGNSKLSARKGRGKRGK